MKNINFFITGYYTNLTGMLAICYLVSATQPVTIGGAPGIITFQLPTGEQMEVPPQPQSLC